MALSRTVSEIQWDIAWKSQIFGTSPLFGAPVGPHRNFAAVSPVGKIEWRGYQAMKKFDG